MPERTIRHVFYSYADEDGRRKVAYQGDKVDLTDAEIGRGEKLGAFTSSDLVTAASQEPVVSGRVSQEAHLRDDAPAPSLPGEAITGDYESHKASDLQAEADRRGLEVAGTGANGNVLKDDLVDALMAHDAGDDT